MIKAITTPDDRRFPLRAVRGGDQLEVRVLGPFERRLSVFVEAGVEQPVGLPEVDGLRRGRSNATRFLHDTAPSHSKCCEAILDDEVELVDTRHEAARFDQGSA